MTYIIQAAGFGFAAGTSPGPLLSFLINTTLSYGWRRGLLVVIAPLITDLPIILVMTFLLGALPDEAVRLLQLVGGLYVLWLAWGGWRAYRAGETGINPTDDAPVPVSPRRTILQAVGMNYVSPGPYIFWGAVTGPILRSALDVSVGAALSFLVMFYGTFLGLMAVWVMVFDRLRRLDPRLTRWVLLASLVVLAGLGIQLVVSGVWG
jgi:threonine/homoserine/homoserine lactone efflux protein